MIRPLKIAHTSDVHLHDGEGKERVRTAFTRVVDEVLESGAELFLIAGDLYDHNRVKGESIDYVYDQLSRLSCPTVIIAGNHDLGVLGTIDENTKIIPGHGPLSTKSDLRAYRNMLSKVATSIGRMIKAKKTLEQVVAAKPTREFDAVWGNGFLKPDQFVEIVYKSMSPEKAAAKAR